MFCFGVNINNVALGEMHVHDKATSSSLTIVYSNFNMESIYAS